MYNVEQRLIIITEWISLAEDCVKRYHYQLFISFRITVSLKTPRFSLPASINLWRAGILAGLVHRRTKAGSGGGE